MSGAAAIDFMRPNADSPIHLTYCTNVHPGESWTETMENLGRHSLAVRDRVCPRGPFGLGLRLSDLASRELAEPRALDAFKQFLNDERLYVFTINGFPFGRFHGARVKERVHAPDWTRPERLDYTRRLGGLLAALLPEGVEGSVSTSPGSFKPWVTSEEQVGAIVGAMAECARDYDRISMESGREIRLAIEPEPFGFLETVEEAVEFFDRRLMRDGVERLRRDFGSSEAEASGAIERRLGLCYDTCHMAVQFADPARDLALLARAGMRLAKAQISSALRLTPTADSIARLRRFDDGVYLHQVVARDADGAIRRWPDIDAALAQRGPARDGEEWRVHCHVPLTLPDALPFGSTSGYIRQWIAALESAPPVAHLEIETYTWDVLPEEARPGELVDAVAAEFDWLMRELQQRA